MFYIEHWVISKAHLPYNNKKDQRCAIAEYILTDTLHLYIKEMSNQNNEKTNNRENSDSHAVENEIKFDEMPK